MLRMYSRLIDLSHPLDAATPPFPGDPAVEIEILDATAWATPDGPRHVNCSRLAACVHCGTHMDAPFHFFQQGATIDQVALETGCGAALRIDLGKLPPHREILPDDLRSRQVEIRNAQRVVLQTGWDARWGQAEYFAEHPVLSAAAAEWLADQEIRLLGVDFPSVDQPPYPAHLVLLGRGIVILENLTGLDQLQDDHFELTALPLRLTGRDGSPVRAIARQELPSPTSPNRNVS